MMEGRFLKLSELQWIILRKNARIIIEKKVKVEQQVKQYL